MVRFRRLRTSPALRRLIRETELAPHHLILPLFVRHGHNVRNPIASMPGQFQLSIDQMLHEIAKAEKVGISSVLLFGIPQKKDPLGQEAYAANGIVQQAVRAIKRKFPRMIVFTDLCFCEYTNHGHCGLVKKRRDGTWDVDNDATLTLIEKTAVQQARAGADFVAPSGMMDHAVEVIRRALDKNGFKNTGILSYAAKYASVFYGPFRDAAESSPKFGDRKTYQMDPPNVREAIKEIEADLKEGADLVMVKPALSYLDVIARVKPLVHVPLVAYNVSGEYAMVKAAEKMGWLGHLKDSQVAIEILTSIRRAGADLILTYHALEVAPYLKG